MFRLRVLGGFALDDGSGGPAPALPKRRADAVLAVLAVCGDLGCSRERLLALLWPESDEAGARHGLRDALHTIRRALGPGAVPAGRLLRLDPAVVASDAVAFDEAFAAGRYADAVTVYGGPLLDGYWRARILARLDETDEALDVIERLLAGPSLFSVHELRISPDFDSLRGNPRYQALLR
jgi:hypothetical protein